MFQTLTLVCPRQNASFCASASPRGTELPGGTFSNAPVIAALRNAETARSAIAAALPSSPSDVAAAAEDAPNASAGNGGGGDSDALGAAGEGKIVAGAEPFAACAAGAPPAPPESAVKTSVDLLEPNDGGNRTGRVRIKIKDDVRIEM